LVGGVGTDMFDGYVAYVDVGGGGVVVD